MKKIMMLALALTVTTIAFTQRPQKDNRPSPELKKEMRSYIEQNVAPVLQKAQDDFDANLSADDLTFIQAKRAEAAAIKAEKRAEREQKKADRPTKEERKAMKEKIKNMTDAEKEAFHEERMAQRKEKREQFKAEHGESRAEVKEFMKRNEALITSTMESLKPQYEKWVADQKAIVEKYRPEDAPEMKRRKRGAKVGLFGLETPRGKRHRKMGKKGKRGEGKMKGEEGKTKGEGKGKKRAHKKGAKLATAFVLWDGTVPAPPAAKIRNEVIENGTSTSNAKVLLGQSFPNPATGITQIEIQIPEGVNQMTLTVSDLNGKIAHRLNLTNLNVGKEIVDLDVSKLPNGQYFYTIEYNGQKESKKMTVSH